jgi:hypothetical protein
LAKDLPAEWKEYYKTLPLWGGVDAGFRGVELETGDPATVCLLKVTVLLDEPSAPFSFLASDFLPREQISITCTSTYAQFCHQ